MSPKKRNIDAVNDLDHEHLTNSKKKSDENLWNLIKGSTTSWIYAFFWRCSSYKSCVLRKFRNDKRWHGRADNEIHNHENDDLSKKSRGKEKMSDSKSSWSLLTESSEGGISIDTTHEFSGPSSS
ncbi:hypothetical protein JHK87_048142 [Glycine soja]|nr:hypothetical protein JHK87_048142 [Glycine soja]